MKIGIIGVPSALGLHPDWNPEGAEKLPQALRNAGFLERFAHAGLEIEDLGDIPVPKYNYVPDPETRLYNKDELAILSRSLAARVDETLRSGYFPLILAGDCSALIGSLAGLASIASLGLFYLDAHCDFYTPETIQSFVFSDMDLAIATGRGLQILTKLAGKSRLVQDENVVVFGMRRIEGSIRILEQSKVRVYDDSKLGAGIENPLREAIDYLGNRVEKLFLHFDVDVIDPLEMPAVIPTVKEGLTFTQVETVLRRVIDSGKVAGMQVTIFNPNLDPDGSLARKLVELLASVLASR